MMILSAKEISNQLAAKAEVVAKYLLPAGKRVGRDWCIGSVGGEAGDSLKICLQGDKVGLWADFAAEKQSGDLLHLWCAVRHLSLAEAISEAKQWLGITSASFKTFQTNKFDKPNISKFKSYALQEVGLHYLIEERKLNLEILQKFDIRASATEIIFPYWRDGELLQTKYLAIQRINGKKTIRVEKNCEPSLFGWIALSPSAREIAITEGEIDAMSLCQCGIPALSLPFGSGSGAKHRWLEYEFERLAIFDVIYLCLDQDLVDQQTLNELVMRLGRHRCRIVALPYKDANECLQKGISVQQMQAYFSQAKTLDPIELKSATEFSSSVINGFYPPEGEEPGIFPPWNKAQGKIKFRPGELSVWSGINGHGKSQFLGHIMLSSMQQGARICIASLELTPTRLLMRLTRQAAGVAQPSAEFIEAIHEWYCEKLWIFDVVGSTKIERLLEVFLYAMQRYGIKNFVIDSMMKCGMAEDDFNAQKLFVERLCDFKNQYQCHIHLIAHPRKANDETKPPNKLDIKGAGAISDLADNCFTVWRNKTKENKVNCLAAQGKHPDINLRDEPDCLWVCDKQRNGEWEGRIALWFDSISFQYLDHCTAKPNTFVNYSKRTISLSK